VNVTSIMTPIPQKDVKRFKCDNKVTVPVPSRRMPPEMARLLIQAALRTVSAPAVGVIAFPPARIRVSVSSVAVATWYSLGVTRFARVPGAAQFAPVEVAQDVVASTWRWYVLLAPAGK
jgi:hypothetical protein